MTAHLVDSRTMDTRKSYEQTYNTGCNYANMGDLTSAEKDDVFSRQLVTAAFFLILQTITGSFLPKHQHPDLTNKQDTSQDSQVKHRCRDPSTFFI